MAKRLKRPVNKQSAPTTLTATGPCPVWLRPSTAAPQGTHAVSKDAARCPQPPRGVEMRDLPRRFAHRGEGPRTVILQAV